MPFNERDLRSSFRPGPSQRAQRMPMSPSPQPVGMDKPQAAGGFLGILATAGLTAIGSYLSARAQKGMQERGWQHTLELERMRIEAEKELDRERRTLDPAIYAMVKKAIMKPLGPHGGGAGKPPTGTFRGVLEPRTPTPVPGGGSPGEFDKYLGGGI